MSFTLREAAPEFGALTESEQTVWLETAYAEARRLLESGEPSHDCRGPAVAAANVAVRRQRGFGLPAAEAADRSPAAPNQPLVEQLVEFTSSRGLSPRVDASGGRIFGVKVLGLESRNGRSYLPEVVAAAAPLYEGVKVNVNHPQGRPQPRDYRDRLGCLRNVRATADGLFGDLYFNPRHALAEQLAWDAEHAPENLGLSHNVQARTRRQGDTVVVEAIERVNSVDLVADPATTRSLFEGFLAQPAAMGSSEPANPHPPSELEELRRRLARLESLHESRPHRPLPVGVPQSRGPEPPRDRPADIAHWARSIT